MDSINMELCSLTADNSLDNELTADRKEERLTINVRNPTVANKMYKTWLGFSVNL